VISAAEAAESIAEHVVFICASTVGFLILCVGTNIASEPLGPILAKCGFGEHLGERGGELRALRRFAATVLLVIPAVVYALAVPIGAVLASVEGWAFRDGFWWCVAAQLGGGMALSGATIATPGGRLTGTLAAAWSIGVAALSVGLSSAPAMEPLQVWLRALASGALFRRTSPVLAAQAREPPRPAPGWAQEYGE